MCKNCRKKKENENQIKISCIQITKEKKKPKLIVKLQDTSIIFKVITIHTIKYTEAMKVTSQKSCT